MSHRAWITLSGYVWFIVGVMLLYKGLKFVTQAMFMSNSISQKLANTFGSIEQAATVLIAIGVFIGFLKGRIVFAKTVRRVVLRIVSQEAPVPLRKAYHFSYWIVILFMMTLGMSMKYLPIALDIRGVIDVAVGSALINGAFLYFRAARSVNFAS